MACRPIPTMTKSHHGGNVSLMIKMGMWCLRISLKHTYCCYHHYDHHHLHSRLHHHHHQGVQWFTTKCPSGRLHNICWATLRFIWKVHLIMTMMTVSMTMVTGKISRSNWSPLFMETLIWTLNLISFQEAIDDHGHLWLPYSWHCLPHQLFLVSPAEG